MVNFCTVCGCCTQTDIVREHLEDTLRICDVSLLCYYFPNVYPNLPCQLSPVGGNRRTRRKPTTFGRALTDESIAIIKLAISEVKGACSDDCATEAPLPHRSIQ